MGKKGVFCKTSKEIKELPEGRRERAERLLQKAIFMEDQLQRLQEILREKGWTETYQNGANQIGVKKSSEAEVYNTVMKNFLATIKQIESMLEIVAGAGAEDDLLKFIGRR